MTLTRHGEPIAVVIRPDRLRTRRSEQALDDAERVRDIIAGGRSEKLSARPRLSAARADEMVAEVRAARSGR